MASRILTFTTKAGTLAQVQHRLKSARIARLVQFTVADWRRDRGSCLAQVSASLGAVPWIVRSSCQLEDGASRSNAGAYLTLRDVPADGLERAIEQVIASYGAAVDADEVLIQPMLQHVVRSGVAFSHDPNTCTSYRVVNWTEGSDTARVTGGYNGRTWQGAALSPFPPPRELVGTVALLDELLMLFDGVPLDCEFAVTHKNDTDTL